MKIRAEVHANISRDEAIRITLETLRKEFDILDDYYIADGHIFEDIDVGHHNTDIESMLIREAKPIDKCVIKVMKRLHKK